MAEPAREHSVEEIAREFGISKHQVRDMIFVALMKFRRIAVEQGLISDLRDLADGIE